MLSSPFVIGIYGGSFDPLHVGHCHVATTAQQALQLDELWWLPNRLPVHKSPTQASGIERVERIRRVIARQAVSEQQQWRVETVELDQPQLRYTVDTLMHLKQQAAPNCVFWWVMGMDSYLSFPHWKNWPGILSLVNVAVVPRGGYEDAVAEQALQDQWPSLRWQLEQQTTQPLSDDMRSIPQGAVVKLYGQPVTMSSSALRQKGKCTDAIP